MEGNMVMEANMLDGNMPQTDALEIRGISKSFGQNTVLQDLNLSLRKGDNPYADKKKR